MAMRRIRAVFIVLWAHVVLFCPSSSLAFWTTTTTTTPVSVEELKVQVLTAIEPTERGLATSSEQKLTIDAHIRVLENACTLLAPARDPRMNGGWEVLYTTAPPPSNGKLGPFVGIAKQNIDLLNGRYTNVLQVGGKNGDGANKNNNTCWLTAILDATWKEWDGTLLVDADSGGGGKKWRDAVVELDDNNNNNNSNNEEDDDDDKFESTENFLDSLLSSVFRNKNKNKVETIPDYGATSWLVGFKTITIRLFGIPIFNQKFPKDTARVWKMTYLDDDTRIVRAGRTGNTNDDVVFYMVRDNTL